MLAANIAQPVDHLLDRVRDALDIGRGDRLDKAQREIGDRERERGVPIGQRGIARIEQTAECGAHYRSALP